MRQPRTFSHIQRPVGVRGIRFRSKAEANYAAYLDWLLSIDQIKHWAYESKTYWFTWDEMKRLGRKLKGVRAGVTSYTPDFVVSPCGFKIEYHEVKGYMDARSKTALARMATYYPEHTIVVIDSKQMRALARQVGGIVPGWIR